MMVFDLSGDGITLTTRQDGVSFDLDGDGRPEQISWTSRNSDDAILAIDINGNGQIDDGSEIVGRQLRVPHGTWTKSGAMLLTYELQGIQRGPDGRVVGQLPESAGEINRDDAIFGRLRLWSDRNHDGRSAPAELSTLSALRINRIYASFGQPRAGSPKSVDALGNKRLYEGSFFVSDRGTEVKRQIVEFEPVR
jgi:hypothetical protein